MDETSNNQCQFFKVINMKPQRAMLEKDGQ